MVEQGYEKSIYIYLVYILLKDGSQDKIFRELSFRRREYRGEASQTPPSVPFCSHL